MEVVYEANKTEFWAILEIMGHNRFAGLLSEQTIAGASFVRIDIPATSDLPAFSKLFGASAVYAITPCTEETARAFASEMRKRAFSEYEAPRLESKPSRDYIDFDEPLP